MKGSRTGELLQHGDIMGIFYVATDAEFGHATRSTAVLVPKINECAGYIHYGLLEYNRA